MALLRKHFQRHQESHTHRGFGTGSGLDEGSSKLKIPALSRAKNALASSIDNLRTRQQNNQSSRKSTSAKTREGGGTAANSNDKVSQSLDLPVHSPLFTRKAKLDDLMAPISMSPSPSADKEQKKQLQLGVRERSNSERLQKHKIRELTTASNGSDREEKDKAKESIRNKSRRRTPPSMPSAVKEVPAFQRSRSPSPLVTSPPATSQKTFDNFLTPRRTPALGLTGLKGKRLSRTPPAQTVSTASDHQLRRGHKRSTSYTCRAEIFESVNTPERRNSYDVCESWLENVGRLLS